VSLSTSPCWRRVRQLEESGVISGYHAHLDRHRVGYGVLGFVQLGLHDHTAEVTAAFEREVLALPQVLSCHNLSGRYDYQLELVAPDLEIVCRLCAHAHPQPARRARNFHELFAQGSQAHGGAAGGRLTV
jgi:DNA-binding Lrp family transcriptional regulator